MLRAMRSILIWIGFAYLLIQFLLSATSSCFLCHGSHASLQPEQTCITAQLPYDVLSSWVSSLPGKLCILLGYPLLSLLFTPSRWEKWMVLLRPVLRREGITCFCSLLSLSHFTADLALVSAFPFLFFYQSATESTLVMHLFSFPLFSSTNFLVMTTLYILLYIMYVIKILNCGVPL